MKNEVKLVKKIKRLLRRAKMPRWLHHFGPKKYEFWQHILALFIRQACKLSFRRAVKLLLSLGFDVPSYSALAKMNKRASRQCMQIFASTCSNAQVAVASIDATTLTRTNASWHYMHRIDREKPIGKPLKLSQIICTRTKKILALRLRAVPRHDTKDVAYLLKHMRVKPRILVADKGYDSEAVHELCAQKGIISMIPARKRVHKGFYRKKMMKHWRTRTYHRREMSEATFGSNKQKYGSSMNSRLFTTQRADAYCRATLHNLSLVIQPEIFNSAVMCIIFKKLRCVR